MKSVFFFLEEKRILFRVASKIHVVLNEICLFEISFCFPSAKFF